MKKIAFIYLIIHLLVAQADAQILLNESDSQLFQKFATEIARRDTIKSGLLFRADGTEERIHSPISEPSFDTLFKPIFSKVMLGNADIVNQGSAYALTVDQFQSIFSLNYSRAKNKSSANNGYFNFGFAASSSSKSVPIFSKDEWQQGFTLTFGFTKSLVKTRRFAYDIDLIDFEKQRKNTLVMQLKETFNLLSKDTLEVLKQIDELNNIDITFPLNPKTISSVGQLTLNTKSALVEKAQELEKIRKIRSLLYNSNNYSNQAIVNGTGDQNLESYVDSLITSFELEYVKNLKLDYSFIWFNILARPEYKGISIYDTSAAKLMGIQKKDYFRFGVEGSINYAHSHKNLFFGQISLGIKNTNALEGKKPDEVEFLKTPLSVATDIKETGEAVLLNDYSIYKKQFVLLNPGIGFNWFFGSSPTIGFETFATTKLGLKSKNIPFDNTFTIRFGPLLSLNGKTDLTKSTFGLIAQWEDLKYKKPSIQDGFTLGVRIGIPFNN